MAQYTTTQAAKVLGIEVGGQQRVHQMILSGEIPATKVGRRYLIADDDLTSLIRDRSGVQEAAEHLEKIVALEAEVAQLRLALAAPSDPASRQRVRAIRAEWEIKYGRRKRHYLSRRLRWLILERDGHRCVYCGAGPINGAQLTIDHVIPVIDGGTDDPDNLVTACDECNEGKRDRPLV